MIPLNTKLLHYIGEHYPQRPACCTGPLLRADDRHASDGGTRGSIPMSRFSLKGPGKPLYTAQS